MCCDVLSDTLKNSWHFGIILLLLTAGGRKILGDRALSSAILAIDNRLRPYPIFDWEYWLSNWEYLEPLMQQLHFYCLPKRQLTREHCSFLCCCFNHLAFSTSVAVLCDCKQDQTSTINNSSGKQKSTVKNNSVTL